MTASNIEVRPLRADERAEWEPLWKGYQAFYKVVISDQTTAVTWGRLHDPAEPMEVLGAYLGERLCGIVHYTDGIAGTRRRLATAEKYVKNFSIATECGFGRRPRDTISELLAIHAAAAE